MAGQKGDQNMGHCGDCKHCKPNDICNGDCVCKARGIEVSEDDDIRFYGDFGEPCAGFTPAG